MPQTTGFYSMGSFSLANTSNKPAAQVMSARLNRATPKEFAPFLEITIRDVC